MICSDLAPSCTARLVLVRRPSRGNNSIAVRAQHRASDATTTNAEVETLQPLPPSRRRALASALAAAASAASLSTAPYFIQPSPAAAFQPPGFKKDLRKGARRRGPLPAEAFSEGPEGLKYYDFKVGTGPEAKLGDRVVVHYEARWKGVCVCVCVCVWVSG